MPQATYQGVVTGGRGNGGPVHPGHDDVRMKFPKGAVVAHAVQQIQLAPKAESSGGYAA